MIKSISEKSNFSSTPNMKKVMSVTYPSINEWQSNSILFFHFLIRLNCAKHLVQQYSGFDSAIDLNVAVSFFPILIFLLHADFAPLAQCSFCAELPVVRFIVFGFNYNVNIYYIYDIQGIYVTLFLHNLVTT